MVVFLSFVLEIGLTTRLAHDIVTECIADNNMPSLFESVVWEIADGALFYSLSLSSLFFKRKP